MSEIDYFQGQIDMGFTTEHFDTLVSLHTQGAKYLQTIGCKSVFEFGSGLGFFVLGAQNIGLDVIGYGIDWRERDFAISKGVKPENYILGTRHNLNVYGKFDAAYCIEVAEHIEDDELIPIFTQLAKHCGKLYFTSTPYPTLPEEDAAWGHINLKQKNQWIDFMARCGWSFIHDVYHVTPWGLFFTSNKYKSITESTTYLDR